MMAIKDLDSGRSRHPAIPDSLSRHTNSRHSAVRPCSHGHWSLLVPSLAVHKRTVRAMVGRPAFGKPLTPPPLPHAYPALLLAINAVPMPRLKSPTTLLPSPPPHHAEFACNCWLLLAIADLTHTSLPGLPPKGSPLLAIASLAPHYCHLPLYIHTSARGATRKQTSGCWRAI